MLDLYLKEEGDLALSSSGDLAITPTTWRQAGQEVFWRVYTEDGDFLLHPEMGAGLSRLYGLPNNLDTAEYGKELISQSLTYDGRFSSNQFFIRAVPVSENQVRFDIGIIYGGREQVRLQVTQEV